MPARRDDGASIAEAFPEMTRGLRYFGSLRGKAGEDQDRFFAPLLAARREVERAADTGAKLRAFDAVALRATWTRWVRETAAVRCPRGDAESRALAVHLADEIAPLLTRVTRVAELAAAARGASAENRQRAWREWTEAVGAAFSEADGAWDRIVRLLDGWIEVPLPWWRRTLARISARRYR
ncbi:MAG: hypothetical protein NVS1B4_00390 [Gemmatimonadaceae bacterium]